MVLSDACSRADTCAITTGLSAYTPRAPSRPFSFYKAKQVVSRGCFTAKVFSNVASNDPVATFLIAILQTDLTLIDSVRVTYEGIMVVQRTE